MQRILAYAMVRQAIDAGHWVRLEPAPSYDDVTMHVKPHPKGRGVSSSDPNAVLDWLDTHKPDAN